ncbi:Uncharacterized protein Rs2_48151 [Raphanus sativus]|nr:Uncharacterized protein Rs2_48151 [Raphanus sativus]
MSGSTSLFSDADHELSHLWLELSLFRHRPRAISPRQRSLDLPISQLISSQALSSPYLFMTLLFPLVIIFHRSSELSLFFAAARAMSSSLSSPPLSNSRPSLHLSERVAVISLFFFFISLYFTNGGSSHSSTSMVSSLLTGESLSGGSITEQENQNLELEVRRLRLELQQFKCTMARETVSSSPKLLSLKLCQAFLTQALSSFSHSSFSHSYLTQEWRTTRITVNKRPVEIV